MTKLIPLMAVSVALAAFGAPELVFKNHGKVLKQFSLEQMKQIVSARELEVYEPNEKEKTTYRVFPMNALLDSVYGESWKKDDEILFTCSDGYQPSLPIARFLKYSSYLAFERSGSSEFTLINKLHNGGKVDLGPFYLVWDNLTVPALKATGAEGWPYQLVSVDLIQFTERFPKMAPPKNAPATAKRGFLVFRQHCLSCHSVNGDGGAKGVELNYPASITEYWKESWLRQWITNPSSVRYGTLMPAFDLAKEGGKSDLDDLLAYLKTMAANKRKPGKVSGPG